MSGTANRPNQERVLLVGLWWVHNPLTPGPDSGGLPGDIQSGPQVRPRRLKQWTLGDLDELAASIKANGLLQPRRAGGAGPAGDGRDAQDDESGDRGRAPGAPLLVVRVQTCPQENVQRLV